MINEIVFMDRASAERKLRGFVPPAILSEFYAAIIFYDPKKKPINLPSSIKPVLCLECESSILSQRYNFNQTMAERVVTFCDFLESSTSAFCLFVQSERGVHRAPAIAKFVKAVKTSSIRVRGLVKELDQTNPDPVVMKLLTAEWTKRIAADAEKYRKKNG